MTKQFSIQLIKKIKITKDVYSFFFNKPNDFKFLAGQYVRVIIEHKKPDEKGSSRFFTIASNPLDNHIMITTKLRESSFKKALLELRIGQSISVFGPIGQFYLNENSKSPLIFLAGGMGITPFHSMVSYIHQKNLQINTTLLASFSSIDDKIFYDVLSDLTKKNKFIKVIYTITGEGASVDSLEVEVGRISEELIRKHAPNFLESEFYLTGPRGMVDSTYQMLRDLNISDENIIIEKFTGY